MLKIIQVATSYQHILHPIDLKKGLDPESSLTKRIAGIALFVFFSIVSAGAAAVFFILAAHRKITQIKEVPQKNDPLEPPVKTPQLPVETQKPDSKSPYNLDEAINRVIELSKTLVGTDKKLCLFVGRSDVEPLPQEEKSVWVSLDDQLENDPPQGERLHLKIDFNQDLQAMAKIKGVFDKIVMDQGVLKFFKPVNPLFTPWTRLGGLLKRSPNSELITESENGLSYNVPFNKQHVVQGQINYPLVETMIKQNKWFESYQQGLTEAKQQQKQAEFLSGMSPEKKDLYTKMTKEQQAQQYKEAILEKYCTHIPGRKHYYDMAMKTLTKCLSYFFSHVELVQKKPYVYPTNYCEGKSDYWILRGPKDSVDKGINPAFIN